MFARDAARLRAARARLTDRTEVNFAAAAAPASGSLRSRIGRCFPDVTPAVCSVRRGAAACIVAELALAGGALREPACHARSKRAPGDRTTNACSEPGNTSPGLRALASNDIPHRIID
ncbi:hypothetical protein [Nannocystis sp. SCPEA4]|uniref:hypothetical protein n=1 Tax=Nannocystis sp. SCPEA4 TaxID=2996787 RepID=UPI00226E3A40|nr:hypothetical protein [Nannocystis sp. SCPEA4]MCY1059356.1 hypothetical protein [Nannocystis sp. SCPEA4]